MGMNKYIREAFATRSKEDTKTMLIELRQQPSTVRLDRPTRLDRAKNLGYRAKQGYFIIRQRIVRGGHQRPHYRGGKRSKNNTSTLQLDVNYRRIAELRAAKKHPNAEVLNSYLLTKDGQHAWYEIIMVDRNHPAILKDTRISWISKPANRSRAFRGLTSAGKKGRGLRHKGKGAEKVRS